MQSGLQFRPFLAVTDWFWRRALCLLLGFVLPGTCYALEIRPVQSCSGLVLRLRGDINDGDYARLNAHFRKKAPIVGFDLSSDGGVFEEGLRIADLVRRKMLTVYVSNECDSACVEVFFASAHRHFAVASKIGVHSVSNDRDVEDLRSKITTLKMARIWAQHGVPNSVIGKMVSTRPKAITYLNRVDLDALHASAGNPFCVERE